MDRGEIAFHVAVPLIMLTLVGMMGYYVTCLMWLIVK